MLKKVLLFVCIFSLLFSPITSYSTQANEGTEPYPPTEATYASDQLIIKLKPEAKVETNTLSTHVISLDQALVSVNAIGLVPLKGLPDTYILKMQNRANILGAVETLNKEPAVEYAEPDYLAHFASIPDDPRYTEQWGLSKIAGEGAWDQSMGSPSIVIAIIDSGIDLTHEDLAPNLWVNPGEIPGNGLDDDNNTFIDDVQGWNYVDSTNNVQDYIGHGSMVAGVAAARINNTVGIAGVCGNCHIMPVKVSQVSGFANYSDIAAGVAYATQKGARVINISLGGYANSITLRNVISTAVSQNIVVVAGAGNDNSSSPFYPAAYENVIAVAGTDQNDLKTTSSNFGPWVDVSAPGIDILSTTLGGYSFTSGTSFSAPFVSGAAGLLLTLHPEWTPAMIRSQFLHTSEDIDGLNPGFEGLLGKGRLNATLALQPPLPILTYQSYSGNGVANFRPDFGSTVDLTVSLFNDWSDAAGVTGTLSSTDSSVTITNASADFGNILAGEIKANAVPFSFNIASGAGYNHAMPFELALSANDGGYTTTLNFTITTRSSEEPISGTIDTDTTWTNDKTYKVTGNVGVAPGFTLTIEPGTSVKFAGNYSLNIGGTLIAQGTAEQPIRFEPYTPGNTWGRIFFDDTSLDAQTTAEGAYQSGNILQYVELVGASTGIGFTIATPFLDHVTTDYGGISGSLGSTDLWLTNSELTGTVSISQGGSNPEHLVNMNVSGGDATLPASSVTESSFGGALTIQGNGQVSETTLGSLSIQGIGDVQQVTSDSGIFLSSGQIMDSEVKQGSISVGSGSVVSNSTVLGGGINTGSGSTITHNNVENATGNGISTSGNNTVTFNRVVGAVQGIVASAGVVENNLVANTTGDGLRPGAASVRNNTFTGIGGNAVYLDQVPSAFEYNNFEFNTGTYDVYITVPSTIIINLVAQNNWWGTTDSNLIKDRTWDYYDDYNLAKLITIPVLTAPSQTAPAYVRSVTLDPESPVGIQTVNFTVEFSRPMDTGIIPSLSFGNTWNTKAPMPTGRNGLQAVMAGNGKIYAIGGTSAEGPYSQIVEEYDPSSNNWTTRTSAPTPLFNPSSVATCGGNILTIGVDSAVWEYDPLSDTWTQKASMPTYRERFDIVTAQNCKIYAIGGLSDWFILSVVEEYDPISDTWTTKTPMPTARYHLGLAASSNGKIYAIGGTSPYTVEEYDPTTDTWATKAPMPTARSGGGVVAANNGKIYAIGGGTGEFINVVEEYDPMTDNWTIKSPLPTARSGFGVVAASDGKIYVIGGGDSLESYLSLVEVTTFINETDMLINNPHWIDNTHFRASYDLNVLIPRGEYTVIVQDSIGLDNLMIPIFEGAHFMVDYAGEISDSTPPSQPHVLAWGNGSLTQLSAQAQANDPDSLIVGYRYAIGTTSGGTEVVNWTNISQNQVTHTGLSLLSDQAYYVSFQARNEGGLWSPVGVSNPVVNGAELKSIYLPLTLR